MRAVDIIARKRDRLELSGEEIETFIRGFTRGEIPDYQAAALAMAIVLNGMTDRETTDLTLAMAQSGETLDLTGVVPIAVDKHSTGGVGDKTTLVVAPLVAACGLPVGKMSGRGLGFSGGTLDKLESIPGFRTDLTTTEFLAQLGSIGLALTGQSADLAPADGKLYALRDVTATVQSIPLIASSIMSKKIAAGAQAIVLDVKVGVGAFMTDLTSAETLARKMVAIASLVGRKAVAMISDMNQPLGCAVGNALELKEAIAMLQEARRPEATPDFYDHCLEVSGVMLWLGGVSADREAGAALALQALEAGKGFDKFLQLVQAQGGDVQSVTHPERLPAAEIVEDIAAEGDGWLETVHARKIGEAAVLLGAGRAKKGDPIDPAVGILVHHKVGDYVEAGEPILSIHANQPERLAEARAYLEPALSISAAPVEPLPLFYGMIE